MVKVTDEALVRRLLDEELPSQERVAFDRWLKCLSGPVEEVNPAGQEVFRACTSPEGLLDDVFETQKISRYVDSMLRIETEVEITIAEMEGQFYRDHVTHMIRTFLLGFHLAQEANSDISPQALALACLFHDVAVPAQEAQKILEVHTDLISQTFNCYQVRPARIELYGDTEEFVDALSSVCPKGLYSTQDTIGNILSKRLREKKHDALGAFELWTMLKRKDDQQVLRSLLAVALHHADLGSGQVSCEFPELFLLILADELQEWGRKAFIMGAYQVLQGNEVGAEIERNAQEVKANFVVEYARPHFVTHGRMRQLSSQPVFSPLMQAKAKGDGLKRLANCEIEIKFIKNDEYGYRIVRLSRSCAEQDERLSLYKDDPNFPQEILELSRPHVKVPKLFIELPEQFGTVTLKLKNNGAVAWLIEGTDVSDYNWHITAGHRSVLCRLTELFCNVPGGDPIWSLITGSAFGFVSIVVPDASQEIDFLKMEGGSLTYINLVVCEARKCLAKVREGKVKGPLSNSIFKHISSICSSKYQKQWQKIGSRDSPTRCENLYGANSLFEMCGDDEVCLSSILNSIRESLGQRLKEDADSVWPTEIMGFVATLHKYFNVLNREKCKRELKDLLTEISITLRKKRDNMHKDLEKSGYYFPREGEITVNYFLEKYPNIRPKGAYQYSQMLVAISGTQSKVDSMIRGLAST